MATHLPVAVWRKTVGALLELLVLLNENPHIVMDVNYDADADREEREEVGAGEPVSNKPEPINAECISDKKKMIILLCFTLVPTTARMHSTPPSRMMTIMK
eukprot:3367683-Pyramimonas_sp.AAC.1